MRRALVLGRVMDNGHGHGHVSAATEGAGFRDWTSPQRDWRRYTFSGTDGGGNLANGHPMVNVHAARDAKRAELVGEHAPLIAARFAPKGARFAPNFHHQWNRRVGKRGTVWSEVCARRGKHARDVRGRMAEDDGLRRRRRRSASPVVSFHGVFWSGRSGVVYVGCRRRTAAHWKGRGGEWENDAEEISEILFARVRHCAARTTCLARMPTAAETMASMADVTTAMRRLMVM